MNKRTEQRTQMIIAALALTGLLAYTFVHTGGLMSRYIHPAFVGYMAAFGVELAVAGISFRLASLKRKQMTSRSLLFILISALFVSALANISEGYTIRYGKPLTWVNLGDIDYIQAVIGIAATGLISLMVFAISELIGVDVETVVKQTEREQKQGEHPQTTGAGSKQPEQEAKPVAFTHPEPRTQDEQAERSYRDDVFAILNQGEQLGPTQMARRVGTTKATAHKWIQVWQGEQANEPEQAGQIRRDNSGWKVNGSVGR
jgi:hypothetical protein